MDARLYDDVLQFTECIKDTPEYREYQEKKLELENYPELLEKVEILKKKNFEVSSAFNEDRDSLSEVIRFADENEDIIMEPIVHDFIMAESAFCGMMREILDMTVEQIDL
ncbi:MAG: YlbF family regulator [Lachnospiraceae bacterium]|nr:YlbF family regulator [Lachnospiraceae bacterium]